MISQAKAEKLPKAPKAAKPPRASKTADPTKAPKRSVSLERKMSYNGYVFVLPFLIGALLFFLPMMIQSIVYSFASIKFDTTGPVIEMVGFKNYHYMLLEDQNFLRTLFSSIGNMLLDIPSIILFSMFIAVLLNGNLRGRGFYRAIFLIPVILATGVIEKAEMNNVLMSSMSTMGGIDNGTASSSMGELMSLANVQSIFLSMNINPNIATYVVDIVNNIYDMVTRSGVQILIFLSGMQSVSPQIYEAAQVEGATGWESFWKITFPMISPIILVNAVYTIVDSFTRESNPMMTLIYNYSFKEVKYGIASAISWIYFIIIAVVIVIVMGLINMLVFYQNREN